MFHCASFPVAARPQHTVDEQNWRELGLADHLADGIIAKRIIELARAGERNSDLLCEGALKKLQEHLFGD